MPIGLQLGRCALWGQLARAAGAIGKDWGNWMAAKSSPTLDVAWRRLVAEWFYQNSSRERVTLNTSSAKAMRPMFLAIAWVKVWMLTVPDWKCICCHSCCMRCHCFTMFPALRLWGSSRGNLTHSGRWWRVQQMKWSGSGNSTHSGRRWRVQQMKWSGNCKCLHLERLHPSWATPSPANVGSFRLNKCPDCCAACGSVI